MVMGFFLKHLHIYELISMNELVQALLIAIWETGNPGIQHSA